MKPVRILLPISQHGTTTACTNAAFGLALRFGMTVQAFLPCPAPEQRVPYSTELSPFYFDELIDVGRKQIALEKRHGKQWQQKTAKTFPKVKTELVAAEGLIAPCVASQAKLADFTVLPGIGEEEVVFWAVVRDAALFQSGRPVLIVPERAKTPIGETVVLAWKDTAEAVRAVKAAEPFLNEAKRIRLVSVAEEDGKDETAAGMADYLTSAGLRIELVRPASKGRDVGEVLLKSAAGKGSLLVMGAYGRWRWQEWVFGGATHYVLRHTTIPVLMTH
jgi:nucleotide-binding universal stress UspA family protein